MARLTDTQLIILSAASQRDDRGVELPANIKGEAARKVVGKLMRAGLLEEVGAEGSLPVWRRDDDNGPMALRITPSGLTAIDVTDEATVPPNRCNRKQPFSFSKRLYKRRWRIESAFNRLKDFRRIATRYDKLARNYLASVCLAAALVWWL
jgi:hypothetical protein